MENEALSAQDITRSFAAYTLPAWEELPDLELYMDQVLGLMSRYLGGYPGFGERGLTAAMVNNYVKQGVIPAPIRKKYTRTHLARLIMLCVLKASLPIPVVRDLTETETASASERDVYERFRAMFQSAASEVSAAASSIIASSGPLDAVLSAALRAQAEQALAQSLFAVLQKADG